MLLKSLSPPVTAPSNAVVINNRGIETITPRDGDLQFIAARIETELEFGNIVPETQKEFCRIVNRMADEDGIHVKLQSGDDFI